MVAGTVEPVRQAVATADRHRGTSSARRATCDAPRRHGADAEGGSPARAADALDGALARVVATRSPAADAGAGPPGAPRPTAPMLQRSYHLFNFGTNEYDQLTDAWTELAELDKAVNAHAPLADIRNAWNARPEDQLLRALKRIMAADARKTTGGYMWEAVGWHAHSRAWYFVGRDKAARAVLGESHRASAEATETELANQVLGTGTTALSIRRDVGSYGQKVVAALNHWVSTNVVDAGFASKTERYGYYYNPVTLWGAVQGRTAQGARGRGRREQHGRREGHQPRSPTSARRIYKKDAAFISVAPDQAKATSPSGVEDIDAVRSKQTETMNETSASMRYARSHNMLVDVGPSFTTGRLLKLGEHIGATDREQTAVALALFAFWNRNYWRAASGIHHFHFVMDMLQNFVPGKYKYTGYPADISEVYDFDNVEEVVVDPGEKESDDLADPCSCTPERRGPAGSQLRREHVQRAVERLVGPRRVGVVARAHVRASGRCRGRRPGRRGCGRSAGSTGRR